MGPGTLERCGHGLSSSLLLTTNACALILMALWLQRDGALRGHVAHSARLGCSGWADATARSCSSNIQQRCAAIEEKWPNIPLQITSLWRRCVVLLLNQTNSRYYPTMWVRAGVTLMMQRLRHADRLLRGGWSGPPSCGCLPLTDIDFLQRQGLGLMCWWLQCAASWHVLCMRHI